MSIPPPDDDRRDGQPGRRGRDTRTLEALIIQLDDNMRRDQKEAHDRLRQSINELSDEFRAFREKHEPRVRSVEDSLLRLSTEKSMEDKQHAKQSTFIAIFVSAAMTGFVQAVKALLGGK